MKHPITLSLSKQTMVDLEWLTQDTGLTKTAVTELSIQAFRRLWETPIITFVRQQSEGQDTSNRDDEP